MTSVLLLVLCFQDVEALIRQLGNEDPAVREKAARVLAGGRSETERAVRAATDNKDREIAARARAIVAGWERSDGMDRIRRLASRRLKRQVPDLEVRITSPDPAERLRVLREIVQKTKNPRRRGRALQRLAPEFFNGPSSRELILELLNQIGDPVLADHFRGLSGIVEKYLDHGDARIRASATRSLAFLDVQIPLGRLKRLCADPNADVREQAIMHLSKADPQAAVDLLRRLLQDPVSSIRAEAVGECGTGIDAPELTAAVLALSDDRDDFVRSQVARFVQSRTPQGGEEVLKKLLPDNDEYVRERAAEGLVKLNAVVPPGSLARCLDDENGIDALEHLKTLINRLDAKDRIPLMRRLLHRSRSGQLVGLEAADDLVRAVVKEGQATPAELIADADPRIRAAALSVLDQKDRTRTVETLLRLLDDSNQTVQTNAVSRLACLEAKETAGEIERRVVAAWDAEGQEQYLAAAIRALAKMKGRQAALLCRRALTHASKAVVDAGIDTLGKMQDRKSINSLFELMALIEHFSSASEALGAIGGEHVQQKALELISDSNVWQRAGCFRVLRTLGVDRVPLEVLALLDSENASAREQAWEFLRGVEYPSAARALRSHIHDPKHGRTAILMLAEARDHASVDAIRTLIDEKDEDVRARAIEALGMLGDTESIPKIMANLDDDDPIVQENAALALGRLHHAPAAARLVRLVKDPDQELRLAALDALAMIGDRSVAGELVGSLAIDGYAVSKTLASLPREPVIAAITTYLRSDPGSEGMWALRTLGSLKAKEAAEAILPLLQAKSTRLIDESAWCAGRVGLEQAAPKLRELLRAQDSEVRNSAAAALVRLGHPEAYEAVERQDRSFWLISLASRSGVRQAQEDLWRIVRGEREGDAYQAALELARAGDHSVAGALLEKGEWFQELDLLGIGSPDLLRRITEASVRSGIYDGSAGEVIEKLSKVSGISFELHESMRTDRHRQVTFYAFSLEDALDELRKELSRHRHHTYVWLGFIEEDGKLLLSDHFTSRAHWRRRLESISSEH